MGGRYAWFRGRFELSRKLGLVKKQYPVNPAEWTFITLGLWQKTAPPFFFNSRESLNIPREEDEKLAQRVADFKQGKLTYFQGEQIDIGKDYDWLTNPISGYQYERDQHWIDVKDLSREAGDIKYVWEKSRFVFLYDLIRYDYHYQEDQSELVWNQIESWMNANPINCGPNYKCSQEIALRSLNWTFALYYYRNSEIWTEERFQRLLHYLYWNFRHIYSNIEFSLISVRNNHAMTEVASLFMAGLLFPFFPESNTWNAAGKGWLEGEIRYQIYEDGSYLQHSHNYHRVVIQVLTWALYLGDIHKDMLSEVAEDRIRKSMEFLYLNQIKENGKLPNYGANDGALFFPLNNCAYRDYRPALNALYFFLEGEHLYPEGPWQEDAFWYSGTQRTAHSIEKQAISNYGTHAFPEGGYYVLRKQDSLTTIRCASFRDRPAHADNLHLDLWYEGRNILRDAGNFRYNTEPFWQHWFNSTPAHNTISLKKFDQMEKGPRFIWLNWSQAQFAEWKEETDRWIFNGRINAFKQYGKYNTHQRTVEIYKREPLWVIHDEVTHGTPFPIRQYWHPGPAFEEFGFEIEAKDGGLKTLELQKTQAWYANTYGLREEVDAFYFETNEKIIRTIIRLNR